jgi:hypothetical protein
MLTREIRFFATSHLLLYRAPGPGPTKFPGGGGGGGGGGCTGGVTGAHAGHAGGTGHAGGGAPLDPGTDPTNRPTLPAFALSSEVAPVMASGPGVVGGLSHGSVAS